MGKALVILSIFSFYCVIFVIMGLMRDDGVGVQGTSIHFTIPKFKVVAGDGFFDVFKGIWNTFTTGIDYFVNGLLFSILDIPVWATSMLFLPLAITLFWVIVSSAAPGGSG